MPEGMAATGEIAIVPSGRTLGATIDGIDLNQPLDDATFAKILRALGEYGVLRFPCQQLDPAQQLAFSARFGSLEINVAGAFQEPGHPEIMILSNMRDERGRPLGARDAGQDWHTDMSYSETIAFANVLYALKVPQRDGQPLGGTEFANMHAAYDELPDTMKARLDGMTVLHDFTKFWDMMRKRPGSWREPLTAEQKNRKPPVSHPIFLTHPITGRKVLYANPGYAIRINELAERESDDVLEFLFAHQLQEKYRYVHRWTEGDVLLWDDIGTLHNAHADYGPDELRLIKRCQVMADRIFDPNFVRAALGDSAGLIARP
jgi:taurine dioxygenase